MTQDEFLRICSNNGSIDLTDIAMCAEEIAGNTAPSTSSTENALRTGRFPVRVK